MAEVTQTQVEEKLATYIDPYLERDLVSTKCVKDISVEGDSVSVGVVLGFPSDGYRAPLSAKLKELLESIDGINNAKVEVTTKISAHSAQKGVKHIEGKEKRTKVMNIHTTYQGCHSQRCMIHAEKL